MKKLLAILMALIMLLSIGTSAFATTAPEAETSEETDEQTEEEVPEVVVDPELVRTLGLAAATAIAYGVDPEEIVYYNHATVGNTTRMKGDFFTEMWGNATSDIDVRMLIHGYDLILWDGEQAMYRADPSVVLGLVGTENQETGDHTYTISLARDLYYSDGTQITAWDYAFSLLFQMAPEIEEIGGIPLRREHIRGATAYANGETNVLNGVRVLDDFVLSITLDGEYLPFFFELGLLSCNPYPIHVIAPGVSVEDDGNGVYLSERLNSTTLNGTINGESGYRTHPSVTCGPYKLLSFDGTTAEFERNDYYKGNAEGELPLIETLTYTLAENETMLDKLQSGEFQLLNKVTKEDVISAGMQGLAGGETAMENYPRIGLSYIAFACENDTVASPAVRQAFAWCMDRDAIVREYTGNYGIRADSYYGVGQWMYALVNGTVAPPVDPPEDENDPKQVEEYEKALEAWKELSLENLETYTHGTREEAADLEAEQITDLDVKEAIRVLEEDGWTLNEAGIREKDGVVLDLTMIYPEGNVIKQSFEKNLIPYLNEAGIQLTMEGVPMQELLQRYYKQGERDMDMIYLASNFDIIFDPSPHLVVGTEDEPNWTATNQTDEELYRLAVEMRRTEPGEVLEYMQKWIAFEERFNEQLPMLPIYSNIYFDFFVSNLNDYDVAADGNWGSAIIGATLADIPEYEIPGAEEELELEEGEVEIGE